MANDTDLVDFVRSARGPFPISVAAGELEHLGKLPTGWPKATAQDWKRELEQLVSKGLLDLTNGCLTVARAESLQQQSFFDL